MTNRTPSPDILFARFRLNIDPIAEYRVRVLDFPAQKAIAEFLDAVRYLRKPEDGEDLIKVEEYPPYRRLNAALLYLAPTLIHGFEKKVDWAPERHSIVLGEQDTSLRTTARAAISSHQSNHSSGEETEVRDAVALTSVDGEDIWYPSRDEVTDVIAEWAKQWAESTFTDVLQLRDAAGLVDNLYRTIIKHPESDWREYTIGDVWGQADYQTKLLRWKTIPSLLAMLFVSRTQETILGERDGPRQKLIWNLVHDKNTGLSVISDPIRASSTKGEGLIAYKLDFRIQTQAGDSDTPWIALYISLRRYADQPVSKKNKGAVSVYIKMGSRVRKKGWGTSQTLVRLVAKGRIYTNKKSVVCKLGWQDQLPKLIKAVRGRQPAKPNTIFESPSSFNHSDRSPDDTFLIAHATGMKYLKGKHDHPIQSGTSLKDRIDLYSEVAATLGDILESNFSMPVDPRVTLSSRQIRQERIHELWTWDDLHDRFTAPSQKAQRERGFYFDLLHEAIQRATQNHPVEIWVLHQSEEKPLVIEKYLREMLLLNGERPLPETMRLRYMRFADEEGNFTDPLTIDFDTNAYDSGDQKSKRALNAKFKADWLDVCNRRMTRIQTFFSQHISAESDTFALIELYKEFNHERERDKWLKYSLRRACVESNIRSQMMLPIDERSLDTKKYPPGRAHIGRLKNGLRDLILRQTAVLFGQPSRLYQYAGLEAGMANELCVIGLFRHRDQAGLDFPIAVRMFPSGNCDFVLADPETGYPLQPIPYVDGPQLGRYLLQHASKKPNFRLRKNDSIQRRSRLARFATEIIKQANESQPTLILLEADGWRQEGVLPVADGKAAYNSFDISSLIDQESLKPDKLRNIRIMRVRDAGTLGETPQYIQVRGDIWGSYLLTDDIDHMTLVLDTQTNSQIPHAFSIGRRMLSMGEGANKQTNDTYSFADGAELAYKHQRAIEIALLFHQPEDDIVSWLRIPHLLRITPAWNGGNVLLPYPNHLGKTLVKDMVDVMRPKINRRQLLK